MKRTTVLDRYGRRRICLHVLGALVSVTVVASMPAYASGVVVDFTEAPRSGSELAGPVDVSAAATSPAPLKEFSVTIQSQGGHREDITHGPWTTADRKNDTIRATWNTRGAPPIRNGIYTLSATARTQEGESATTAIEDLKVNNPPDKPASPRSSIEGNGARVATPHQAEPDFTYYDLQRSVDGGAFRSVTRLGEACSYRDTDAPRGKELRYRLVAFRSSPVDSNGISSAPSGETAPVVIPPDRAASPPPPPTCAGTGGCGGAEAEVLGPAGLLVAGYRPRCTVTPAAGSSFFERTGPPPQGGQTGKPPTTTTTSTPEVEPPSTGGVAPKPETSTTTSTSGSRSPAGVSTTPPPHAEGASPGSTTEVEAPAVRSRPKGDRSAIAPAPKAAGEVPTTTSVPKAEPDAGEVSALPVERTSRRRGLPPVMLLAAGGLALGGAALRLIRKRIMG